MHHKGRVTSSLRVDGCNPDTVQDEREAAAQALVAALVDSQSQYDEMTRAPDAQPSGNLEHEPVGNRQQRMEQCLDCCSPLMVSLLAGD